MTGNSCTWQWVNKHEAGIWSNTAVLIHECNTTIMILISTTSMLHSTREKKNVDSNIHQ